jgi:WD40 repeat protein
MTKINEKKEISVDYYCPVSGELFFDPVIADDGETYEREAIEQHIAYCQKENKTVTSPLHNTELENLNLTSNRRMKSQVEEHLSKNPDDREEQYLSENLKKVLRDAMEKGEVDVINRILTQDARLLSASLDENGKTLLDYSCEQKSIDLLKNTLTLLTKHNLLEAYKKETRKYMAQTHANLGVEGVRILLDGFGWTKETYRFNLMFSIQEGSIEGLKLALALTSDLNTADESGHTPLHEAAECGDADIIQLLITAGADGKAKNKQGERPRDRVNTKELAERMKVWEDKQRFSPFLQELEKETLVLKKETVELKRENQTLSEQFVEGKKETLELKRENQTLNEEFVEVKKETIELKQKNEALTKQLSTGMKIGLKSYGLLHNLLKERLLEEKKSLKKQYDLKYSLGETLEGHSKPIYSLTVLPNGLLASGSDDKMIKLWDVSGEKVKCVDTLKEHYLYISSFTVLPSGLLASGSDDKTIKLWDVKGKNAKCVDTLRGHSSGIRALAVLPNGLLASGSYDETIKLWDVKGKKAECVDTLKGHGRGIPSLTVLPSGLLASGSWDQTIKLWDVTGEKAKCVDTLKGHSGSICSLTVLPSGLLASGSYDDTIKLWDVSGEKAKCVDTLKGHSGYINSLTVLPSGLLASASNDKTIKLWDVSGKEAKCVDTLTGHSDNIWSLTVLPSGLLASGSNDNTIKLWKPPLLEQKKENNFEKELEELDEDIKNSCKLN